MDERNAPEIDEEDLLDGCDVVLDGDPERVTEDDQVAALVLFADVDFEDPDAVEARRLEWEEVLADGS